MAEGIPKTSVKSAGTFDYGATCDDWLHLDFFLFLSTDGPDRTAHRKDIRVASLGLTGIYDHSRNNRSLA